MNTSELSSREGPRRTIRSSIGAPAGADSFPHLQAVDRNVGIGLKAQPDALANDLEDRDAENALDAIGPTDYHRFSFFFSSTPTWKNLLFHE
jgi:hypothetical protein